MIKIILKSFLFISLSGCAHQIMSHPESVDHKNQKNDINDFLYMETSTGIFNGMKASREQLVLKEFDNAVQTMNAITGIEYHQSPEEKIQKLASEYMAQGKWKAAFDTLIKYEPVLTYNKNLSNQIVYVSMKLDYYDYAIDQLQLALDQKDELRARNETRQEKETILAHAFYLSKKYDLASDLYSKLRQQDHDQNASRYLFLIGYKLNDLNRMKNELSQMGENNKDHVEFSILTAKVEVDRGEVQSAQDRLAVLFQKHSDDPEVVLEYAHVLITHEQYKNALDILDQSQSQVAETRQFHFMKSYIFHQSGDKAAFRRELASTQVEDRYDKMLNNLFLQKKNYNDTYQTIFKQSELDEFKYTQLVKEEALQFTKNYINKPQFKDATLVRQEFKPLTEPIRLPSSLEIAPSE